VTPEDPFEEHTQRRHPANSHGSVVSAEGRGIVDRQDLEVINRALVEEIAERRRIEAVMRENEERFRALAENSLDVIMRFDRECRHLYTNSVVETQTGIRADEFIGKTHRDLGFPEHLCELWERSILRVFETGQVTRVEFQLPSAIWIDWLLVPESSQEGQVTSVITSARDITGRKTIEEELRRVKADLEQRVQERTSDLAQANAALLAEIAERSHAEATLREREQRLRTVIENMPVMMIAFDVKGRIVAWNHECERVTGYAAGEVIGSPRVLLRLYPEAGYRRRMTAEWRRRDANFRDWEWRTVCKDGREKIIAWSSISQAFPVRGWATWGIGRDVTERKQAEEALRESEETARALLNAPMDVIFLLDTEGRILASNEYTARRWGRSPGELIGMRVFDFMDPEVAASRRAHGLAVIENGKPIRAEDVHRGIRFDTTYYPVHDAHGKVSRIAVVGRDITESRKAEEARRRLATAVDQAAEAIMITDTIGTIEYVNPAFERISGYAPHEVIGKNARILKSGRQDPEFYSAMWATLTRGEVWNGHLTNRRQDGTLYEEEATISPIRSAEGGVVNYVAVKRDVTREMELAEELRESQKMRAIGQLAGGVAHDFNNLLQALLGAIEVIRLKASDQETVRRVVNDLEADARRGAALTRQLLLFSRREVMKLESLDLNSLVRGTGSLLTRLVRENIRLIIEPASEILPIRADRGQIEQVLVNLVVNAVDAIPDDGRITIRTRSIGDNEAAVEVLDSGVGMPEEILKRMFEPFFTTKIAEKGTGLGLSVVHGIVTRHGGRIDVKSRPGEGSSFTVVLPRARLKAPSQRSGDTPRSHMPRGHGERVLLVEDERGAREGLTEILNVLGYRTSMAASGEEALQLPPDMLFDVLVTDLVLPGIDGMELANILQRRWPNLRSIIISGYAEDEALRRGATEGTVHFLQKPFTMSVLSSEIRRILQTDAS